MKVRAFLVEDEPVARAGLRAMLAAFDWIEIVGEAADGESALQGIDAVGPDLLFLDVQMPGLLGTDVLRQLEKPPYVIFTTAFSEHAVTAFELGAVDYLLKPFGPRRLAAAMDRARGVIGDGLISRLFVRVGSALVPLAVERISRLEADGDYVIVHLEGARHVLHNSLSNIEERLDPKRFSRVHRAHIVNLDQVKAFKRDASGNLEALMTDGSRVPVSRSRAKELKGAVQG